MRVLLAGGGTGGHLFPAVAIAQRLLEVSWQGEVLFVGTGHGIETRVLPELGLPLETVDFSGFVGKGLGGKLAMLPQLWRSVRQSQRILERFRPHVVVGVGGYASVPMLLAAQFKGLPTLIHEQNAVPGLANRLLARRAGRVCLSFAESAARFRGCATVLTGNPVRKGMAQCPPPPEVPLSLLVFGGSRGAQALNDALLAALPHLEPLRGQLTLLHQTGGADLERVQAGYRAAGWNPAQVVPFIDDMAAAYAGSQLVLCRAGATTIAELTACGRAAVLVPYPHAAGDHQTANAQALAAKGAALLLPQSELDGARLARLLGDLLLDRPRLLDMAAIARSLGRPDAADLILQECRTLSGRN